MRRAPEEIISLILREYMHDFFSTPQNLPSPPPAVLQVSRLWRQIATNDVQCWTKITVGIDVTLPFSPRIQAVPSLSTKRNKALATQDIFIHTLLGQRSNLLMLLSSCQPTRRAMDQMRRMLNWKRGGQYGKRRKYYRTKRKRKSPSPIICTIFFTRFLISFLV